MADTGERDNGGDRYMSAQARSGLWAWVLTFAAGLLTVLTQVMTNGGSFENIDPLAVMIAALAALVSVGKDQSSQRSHPPTKPAEQDQNADYP